MVLVFPLFVIQSGSWMEELYRKLSKTEKYFQMMPGTQASTRYRCDNGRRKGMAALMITKFDERYSICHWFQSIGLARLASLFSRSPSVEARDRHVYALRTP
ncbi:hypothetical protein SAMN04515647_2316 [Cohaesibacter sp. ES.047]|nr:hypothetical protein SAMN04515647_2316 [Cohaesibacter sp. ES.047]